jgi:murein DD-endopeptidase MepM/ murein hydrolase activator NlpD
VAPRPSRNAARHGWFSRGFTALAVSALGLAVAGSIALTSSAQPTPAAGNAPAVLTPSVTPSALPSARPSTPTSVEVFTPETPPSPDPSPHAGVVDSQAAQRAEELAKSAEQLSRAAKAASDQARQQKLTAAEKARQETAAQLAEEALQKAVAARLAAEQSRRAAEQAASTTNPTATDPTTTDPASVPTGGAAVSPVAGAVIGAHFGDVGLWARYHTGLDFRAAYGTPIHAVKAGVVLYAGNSGDWAGNHVAVKHADGMTTMYCHMSSMAAHAGETVQAGQIIGYVGQTGRAFGAHLHFELYPPGVKYGDIYKAINPQPYLNANGVQTH